jgi:hypothetical protein
VTWCGEGTLAVERPDFSLSAGARSYVRCFYVSLRGFVGGVSPVVDPFWQECKVDHSGLCSQMVEVCGIGRCGSALLNDLKALTVGKCWMSERNTADTCKTGAYADASSPACLQHEVISVPLCPFAAECRTNQKLLSACHTILYTAAKRPHVHAILLLLLLLLHGSGIA